MEDSRSSVLEEREQDPTATGAEDERSTFAVVWRVEAPLQHVRDFTFIMLDQLDLELDRLYWELERYVMAQRTGRFSWTQHEKRAAQSKCVHIEEKEEVYERLLWTSWELEDEELSSDVDDAYDILEAAVPLHGTKNFVLYVVEQTDQNLDLQYEDLERMLESYLEAERSGRFLWAQHEERVVHLKRVYIAEWEETYEKLLCASKVMEDEEDAKREVDFTTMGSHDEMQPHRDENVEGRGIASSKMGELCDRRRHPSD